MAITKLFLVHLHVDMTELFWCLQLKNNVGNELMLSPKLLKERAAFIHRQGKKIRTQKKLLCSIKYAFLMNVGFYSLCLLINYQYLHCILCTSTNSNNSIWNNFIKILEHSGDMK